jgi:hypothetical protein
MTSIEDDLRRIFTDPRRDVPAWPDAAERIRSGMRRRHRRRITIGAASATFATLIAVAVTVGVVRGPTVPNTPVGTPSLSLSGVGPVPWRDILPYVPPATQLDQRQSASPCRGGELSGGGGSTGAAAGTQFHIIKVRNTGSHRCTLAGRPELLYTEPGTGTRIAQTSPVDYFAAAAANATPATIDPGESAWLDLETYGGCFTNPGQAHVILTGNVLRLADGSVVPLASTLDATCGIGMSEWFRPTPEAAMLPWTPLVVTITAPATARMGQPLEYVVTLSNPADTPIAITPCPNYTQTLASQGATIGGGVTRQLNCVVDTVPGRGAVQFEMRLSVPSGFMDDHRVSLQWALSFGDSAEPMPSATVFLTLEP